MWLGKKFNKRITALAIVFAMLFSLVDFKIVHAQESSFKHEAFKKAVNWLELHQNKDGSFGKGDISFRDTAEAAEFFKDSNELENCFELSKEWMEDVEAVNNDVKSRILPFISEDKKSTLKTELTDSQNEDGGWGIAKGYKSDVIDTILVLKSFCNENNIDEVRIEKALSYLLNSQKDNGSWSYIDGDDESISLTAETIIVLSNVTKKFSMSSDNVNTALKNAGEFLVSMKNEDGNFGDDEIKNFLCYRAILTSKGVKEIVSMENFLLDFQKDDGSFNEDPYTTVLALKAIKERLNVPFGEIKDFKLFKESEDSLEECYTYNAQEKIKIKAEPLSESKATKIIYYVKNSSGKVVNTLTGESVTWNTSNHEAGQYVVIADVIDTKTGFIIAEEEKNFVIKPTFNISTIMTTNYPNEVRVNTDVKVVTESTFVVQSNINKTLNLKYTVTKGDEVIKEENKQEDFSLEEKSKIISFEEFKPDTAEEGEYIVKIQAFDKDILLKEEEKKFSVLSEALETKINMTQYTDTNKLKPGSNNVKVSMNLEGQGITETLNRRPMDLVLLLDYSGSMQGERWTQTIKASKEIVNMLQPNDRCAIVGFGIKVWVQCDLTSDKEKLIKALDTMGRPYWGTPMAKGIQYGYDVVSKSPQNREKQFIILSDGEADSTSDVYKKIPYAVSNDIKINTIALDKDSDKEFMEDIAKKTGGKYCFSTTPEELELIMTELAGDIFDTAGKNIVLETTIMPGEFDENSFEPKAESITENDDGSKTLRWTKEQLKIGEKAQFDLNIRFNDLMPGTHALLTKNTTLKYEDRSGVEDAIHLPDLNLPVSDEVMDSKIELDKNEYTSYENVKIKNSVKNLVDKDSNLKGKVLILDKEGNTVSVVMDNVESSFQGNKNKDLDFNWNTKNTMAGDYNIAIVWEEDTKVVSFNEYPFTINKDGGVYCYVSSDKKAYTSNESVSILECIENYSSNFIEKDLNAKISIKNSEGEVIFIKEDNIKELAHNTGIEIKNQWNTGTNSSGEYEISIEVLENDTILYENKTNFNIVSNSNEEGKYGVTGEFEILNKEIYPESSIEFKGRLNNEGNTELKNIMTKIRLINVEDDKEVDPYNENIESIAVGTSYDLSNTWKHKALKEGIYLVVFQAVLDDGQEVSLSSKCIEVLKSKNVDDEAFKNTIFSSKMYMYTSESRILGDVLCNDDLLYTASSVTIDGILKSNNISNIWVQNLDIKSKKLIESKIAMPNYIDSIREIALLNGEIKNDININDYGEGISFEKAQIADNGIQLNGVSCSLNVYMTAKGNISFNLNELKTTNPQGVVIASENGDISFNASEVNMEGLVYAPNGTVYINTSNFDLKGRIIAKNIIISSSKFYAEARSEDIDLIDINKIS